MIRPLAAKDATAAIDLLRANDTFSPAELEVARELIDAVTNDPHQRDYYGFVALRGDAGNAVCGVLLLGPTPLTTGTWDMYWIAVSPESHGCGVAQQLDSFAVDFVRERGAYLLIAETSGLASHARARAFYHKQGYAEMARIADYYKPSDDLIIFGKRV